MNNTAYFAVTPPSSASTLKGWSGRYVIKTLLGILPSLLLATSGCAKTTEQPKPVAIFPTQLIAPQADRIVIEKSKHLLTLYAKGAPLASFRVALGREPIGPKSCDGDNRTPEGTYKILEHKRDSAFHLSLRISYPSEADIQRANRLACKPGKNIMIHGLENGYGWVGTAHRSVDWTRGCIALTNEEIERLWRIVPDGTPVEIKA